MSTAFDLEILTRDEVADYFKRQVDEEHIKPYVDALTRLDIGDGFRANIKQGEDAESARTVKRNFNTASKLRHAVTVLPFNTPRAQRENAMPGKRVLKDGEAPQDVWLMTIDGKTDPVVIKWKAETHKETRKVKKDGKDVDTEVTIIDKLVGKLVASEPKVTNPAPTPPQEGTPVTPSEGEQPVPPPQEGAPEAPPQEAPGTPPQEAPETPPQEAPPADQPPAEEAPALVTAGKKG